jgi:hypothetical protein
MNGELFERVAENGLDYFAVFNGGKKGGHLCNAQARSSQHALSIARAHGLRLERGASAVRIGREGYAASVARAFGCYRPLNWRAN